MTYLRINIAGLWLSIPELMVGAIVQIIILIIFSKYGKPLEDDARIVIEEKLQSIVMQEEAEAADPQLQFRRRMRVYGEMAN